MTRASQTQFMAQIAGHPSIQAFCFGPFLHLLIGSVFVIFTVTVCPSNVFAESGDSISGSEFFYQAPSATNDVTFHAGYLSLSEQSKTSGSPNLNQSGVNRLGVGYDYGLNSTLALGADVSYSALNGDIQQNGLNGLSLRLRATTPIGPARLRYGLTFGIPLSAAKQTSPNSGSATTGRYDMIPYIGVDADVATGILGARLRYDYSPKHDFEFADASTQTVSGGDTTDIAVFYECLSFDMLLGVDLDYALRSQEKIAGVTQPNTINDFVAINLYAKVPLASRIDVVPSLSYQVVAGGNEYETQNELGINLLARYGF